MLRSPPRQFWRNQKLQRSIAREAGVHPYADAGTIVTTNGRYLAVTAPQGGKQPIVLPEPSAAVDDLDGAAVARATAQFDVELQPGQCRLLTLTNQS